ATTGPLPLGDAWAYEVKWDGVRALVAVEGGRVRATSRGGNDVTGSYPELRSLSGPDALLDGELVALVDGVPDFGALQARMHVRSPSAALVAATPVQYVPFDVLHVEGTSLLDRPYDERRAVLSGLQPQAPEPFHGDGAALLASTRAQGLEGLVAKRRDSRYLPGRRTDAWVKVKHVRRQSAVVCGWKPGEGGRAGQVGSLLLGVHTTDGLGYAGHVGTGFTDATLRLLSDRLARLSRPTSPYDGPVPPEHARAVRWVEPELVVDVDFTAWTRDGRLRHPSYKGVRDDLDPREVRREP
ncbi:MAG: non-homologous end-joining DNA ligase, partial [Mycobacteriales bacterium]